MLSVTELCSIGQHIKIAVHSIVLYTGVSAAGDTVNYTNHDSSTQACHKLWLQSVRKCRHTGTSQAYLYSRASDAADRKANTALVSWNTAILPAGHTNLT